MEIHIVYEEDVCVVYLAGDLSFTQVAIFEKTVKDLFFRLIEEDNLAPSPVLVDLTLVDFLDSAGVAALVGVHLDSRHRLIELGFSGLKPRILGTLQRTHVDELINLFPDEHQGRTTLIERQRIYQRFAYHTMARLLHTHGEYRVKCLNISKGGCLLFSKMPWPPRITEATLAFENEDIETLVEVRRCQPLADGFEIALAFLKTDEEFHEQIVKLIHRLQPSP